MLQAFRSSKRAGLGLEHNWYITKKQNQRLFKVVVFRCFRRLIIIKLKTREKEEQSSFFLCKSEHLAHYYRSLAILEYMACCTQRLCARSWEPWPDTGCHEEGSLQPDRVDWTQRIELHVMWQDCGTWQEGSWGRRTGMTYTLLILNKH